MFSEVEGENSTPDNEPEDEASKSDDSISLESHVDLVVQGKTFRVERRSLALVSNFFRALFSHQFHDSKLPTLHLDSGGQMGLTVTAIELLLQYAKCGQLPLDHSSAVQVLIAADALGVEGARLRGEEYLGTRMLSLTRPQAFRGFSLVARQRHMILLQGLLDNFCLENFGWFCLSLPTFSLHYITGWDTAKLGSFLLGCKFSNCSEEQVFRAVVSYCQARGGKEGWEELVPGLYRSCGAYLRYIQSVPRTLTMKNSSRR